MQSIGPCDDDFMLFKALLCTPCNQLMHTQCAMAAGQLLLRRSRTGNVKWIDLSSISSD
jgi:hypothetical protein